MCYKIIINPKYNNLSGFIEKIPEFISNGKGRIIYNKRNKVYDLITDDGTELVVKKYKVPLLHQRFDYTFLRKSKAMRAYLYGLKLLELGINTPEPIACLQGYKNGLFHTGYFVSSPCYDEDFRVLADETHDKELINVLVDELVMEHEKGFLHGDPNLSNYLFRLEKNEVGERYIVTTIDINRSKFIANPSQKQCLKRLVRLTHIRPLLIEIIRLYAVSRKWDVDACQKYVIKHLDTMERNNRIKKYLKNHR